MCMHVCKHVCMCARMHACVQGCMHVCKHVCMCASMYACVDACMCASMHACVQACTVATSNLKYKDDILREDEEALAVGAEGRRDVVIVRHCDARNAQL